MVVLEGRVVVVVVLVVLVPVPGAGVVHLGVVVVVE